METKLKEGMRIRLPQSGDFNVVLVNESRAHIVPVKKQEKTINKLNGDKIEFESLGRGLDISPNSECEILSYNVIASEAKQSQLELIDENN